MDVDSLEKLLEDPQYYKERMFRSLGNFIVVENVNEEDSIKYVYIEKDKKMFLQSITLKILKLKFIFYINEFKKEELYSFKSIYNNTETLKLILSKVNKISFFKEFPNILYKI